MLWLRVAHGAQVRSLPEPLAGFRVHQGSASPVFQTVQVHRGRRLLTRHHTRAVALAQRRFVDGPDLDLATRAELAGAVRRCDRRMRVRVAVGRRVPPQVLLVAKRLVRSRSGAGA